MFSARHSNESFRFRLLQRQNPPRDGYAFSRSRYLLHCFADLLPFRFRESFAEAFLRREGAPAPAAEHAFQYLLSSTRGKIEATVAKGADNFYARQYRQYLNPTMGAFVMTATHAALAAGARRSGGRRLVYIAMNEAIRTARPLIVLDRQSVATPIHLPKTLDAAEASALSLWLKGRGLAPNSYRLLMAGDELHCAEAGVRARLQSATGAMLQVVEAALRSRKLACLALHPYDSDAMGLHVTLFGVEALTADALVQDYALTPDALAPWRLAAQEQGMLLYFLVGGVEEAFTQCSENLFVKRRASRQEAPRRAQWPNAWTPQQPLERLLARQFELLQATVSSTGLPGLSPRNGDIGLAGFVVREKACTFLLIPYFAGNAVHGHAAKLWSNPEGALMIWDDHSALGAVTLRGAARVVSNDRVRTHYPDVVARIGSRLRRSGEPAEEPEYWFQQTVAEIALRDEPLAATVLDPARATCSIHAAGAALHGKKPAYFAADELPPYDMTLQHQREWLGRPSDPSGATARCWERAFAAALEARCAHLARIGMD